MKGYILDLKSEESNRIKLLLKGEKEHIAYDKYDSYFYLEETDVESGIESMPEIKKTEIVERIEDGKKKKFLKVYTNSPNDVIKLRDDLSDYGPREADIPQVFRYLIDKNLFPMREYDIEVAEDKIKSMKEASKAEAKLKLCAFDIETYNKEGMPNPDKDPIICISYADEKESLVYSWSREKGSERQMIIDFLRKVERENPDVIIGYNSAGFDIPYLKKRCSELDVELNFSRDESPVVIKKGAFSTKADIFGRIHFDDYDGANFLTHTGSISIPKVDLDSVYKELFGKTKIEVPGDQIWAYWEDAEKRKILHEYNREDSVAAYEIGREILPLYIELSRIVGLPTYDISRMSTSQMIEWLLIREAYKRNMIIPKQPTEDESRARMMNPIKGAFVKLPKSGLHENIVVCDFRSLYPSIIMAYNIDKTTYTHKQTKNKSPLDHYFLEDQEGLIPHILREITDARVAVKTEMKKHEKGTMEYKVLYARQWALKIIANSAYGYMGYGRAKWYSREAAESVTSWAREYIHGTIEKAEKAGFEVLYGDSITSDRFVTLLDPSGTVKIKNIEKLFIENKEKVIKRGEKEVITLTGYRALSVSPKTGKSSWSKIEEIIRHKTDKKIYRVGQKYGESITTEDHSFMTKQGKSYVETKPLDMEENSMIRVAKIPSVKKIDSLDLYELLKDYSYESKFKESTRKAEVRKDESHVWFNWSERKEPVKLKRFIKVGTPEFEALCRLLGAYIPEGSSSTAETTSRKGASISCSDHRWLEQIQKDYYALFSGAKVSVIESDKGMRKLTYKNQHDEKTVIYKDHTHKLQMMNGISAVFFKQLCGQKSSGKKLPDFIFHVDDKYKRMMLEEMIKGDGSRITNKNLPYSEKYKEKFFKYETKSLQLASGMSLLMNQLNEKYSIRYRESKGTYVITRTHDHYNKILRSKIKQENYSGYVYDLSVKGTHTFVDSCGQILLHNTDSVFLKLGDKNVEESKEFIKKINKDLPDRMELEFSGYYPRGIFVTKRSGEEAAKKKYALMREDGTLEVKGFELVRRDWANIAKQAQERVIKAVLKEGKPEIAVEEVKKIVQDLRDYKVSTEDVKIYTQIKRKVDNYEQQAPHVKAAKRLIKEGKKIKVGTILEYVIVSGPGSISDRAVPVELLNGKKYDPDYYIDNQVLPAVMKILHELGVTEDQLRFKGKQEGLEKWF